MGRGKILILVNHDLVIYNFRKELVFKLLEEGYEVYISSPSGKRLKPLIEVGAIHLETKIDRHGTNPLKDYFLYRKYISIMKDVKPDVVLTYTIKPNIYGGFAAKRLNIPYIGNITGMGTSVEGKGFISWITKRLYKTSLQNINTLYFQNEYDLNFFKKNKLISNQAKLLPGSGVNLTEFDYVPYPNDDVIKFIFISRIMKEKGIDYYLNAAKLFKSKYNNVEFHIAGFIDDDKYFDIIEKYKKDNIVIYHGNVEDIKELISQMHCIIHPTHYPEGMSNVLLESAAIGRVLIGTDRHGVREIIDNDVNGFKFQPGNQQELNEKIGKFLKLPIVVKKDMGKQARLKVKNNFDRNIIVNSYITKIEEIINKEN